MNEFEQELRQRLAAIREQGWYRELRRTIGRRGSARLRPQRPEQSGENPSLGGSAQCRSEWQTPSAHAHCYGIRFLDGWRLRSLARIGRTQREARRVADGGRSPCDRT